MLSRKAAPSTFTRIFTPDPAVPTIESAEQASPDLIRKARKVNGSFTWVAPQKRPAHELKWFSPSALFDATGEDQIDDEFADVVAGQRVIVDRQQNIYPFAQNYAGDQFGSWAGQLGDGRAVTLFRLGRYELQLKGAGLTPYSRFADGKAVVRSSIREALASEYLNALGIPTQRVLSLSTLPETGARREQVEHCAVIARMAESYVRIGTFQLHHARQDRRELRKLADYSLSLMEFTDGGIGSRKPSETGNIPGKGNRYFDLFRESALRNARMIAKCQAYGFLNGVLNTDNVSILGLSLDYGPFAFMDTFDPSYTPNHDDYQSRYGFQNAPMAMWWNCVKLGETLGELIGAGDHVDDPEFIVRGTKEQDQAAVAELATDLIMGVGREFQEVYERDYQRLMLNRIGLFGPEKQDDDKLIESMLQMMYECELDYNSFFRRIAITREPSAYIPSERSRQKLISDSEVSEKITTWLAKYAARLGDDESTDRVTRMNSINPQFVLRNSVLANVIDLAALGNWEAFEAAAKMALAPFKTEWDVPDLFSRRYIKMPLLSDRDSQLSCSS